MVRCRSSSDCPHLGCPLSPVLLAVKPAAAAAVVVWAWLRDRVVFLVWSLYFFMVFYIHKKSAENICRTHTATRPASQSHRKAPRAPPRGDKFSVARAGPGCVQVATRRRTPRTGRQQYPAPLSTAREKARLRRLQVVYDTWYTSTTKNAAAVGRSGSESSGLFPVSFCT